MLSLQKNWSRCPATLPAPLIFLWLAMSLSGMAGLCLYARAAASDAAIDWWAGQSGAQRDASRAPQGAAWLAGDGRLGG